MKNINAIALFIQGFIQLLFTVTLTAQTPNTLVNFESNEKGLLIPTMSTAERIAIVPTLAEIGLFVYDEDKKALFQWNGTEWEITKSEWGLQSNNLLFYNGSRNSVAVQINNTNIDSLSAKGLAVFANSIGVQGISTNNGTGISGAGRIGVFGTSGDGGFAVVGISTGTSKAASFTGDVVVDGLMTSDTLISTDHLLRIKPTTTALTCDEDLEGMIQYFKTNRKLRACIETSASTFGWVDLH